MVASAAGMAGPVYGFIRVSQHGRSDSWAIGSFVGGLVLPAAFVPVEHSAVNPITPLRMFTSRDRAAIHVVAPALTGAPAGLFFFLTVFTQNVLHHSPVQAGLAFLPVSPTIMVTVGVTSKPMAGLGQKIPPAAGVALLGVSDPAERGAASGVLNAMRRLGSSLGLSILVTVYGTATRNASGDPAHVLTSGVSTAFGTAAPLALGALIVAGVLIRNPGMPAAPRADLDGSDPAA